MHISPQGGESVDQWRQAFMKAVTFKEHYSVAEFERQFSHSLMKNWQFWSDKFVSFKTIPNFSIIMAKIGQKTRITEIRPAVWTDLYWASQQFAPWSFADFCPTFSGLCFLWYGCFSPSITNWCNEFIQNANAQTPEHKVSLLLLCVCPKRHMKLAKLTNLILNIIA